MRNDNRGNRHDSSSLQTGALAPVCSPSVRIEHMFLSHNHHQSPVCKPLPQPNHQAKSPSTDVSVPLELARAAQTSPSLPSVAFDPFDPFAAFHNVKPSPITR